MHITAIPDAALSTRSHPGQLRAASRYGEPVPVQDGAPASAQVGPDAAPDADTAGTERIRNRQVPGVIRLLESGHFKGVADVRLRINFHEQLATRAAERAQVELDSNIDALIQTVAGETETLVASLQLDDETAGEVSSLLAGFEETLRTEATQTASTPAIAIDTLAAAFESAFTDFTAALHELLAGSAAGTAPPDPAALTAETAPAKDEPSPLADESEAVVAETDENPLAALTAAFQDALDRLTDAIGQAQHLPDPSPPRGNGVAYARFLAIYDALRYGGEPAEVDVAA